MKSGFVTIVGRPSTGKSTLLNSICGHKISITSTTPQTTRNKIKGIFTNSLGQIIFIDTPGFHLSTKKLNLQMMNNVYSSFEDAELVLYVIDIEDEPGDEEKEILKIIKNSKVPFLVLINKIDIETNKEPEITKFLEENEIDKDKIIKISGEKKLNLEELINKIFQYLEDGPLYYPEEYYTDQEMSFRISEIIREEVIKKLKEELPYSIYVEIDTIEDREEMLFIRANIIVLREGQKGIIVGKGGAGIKIIGEVSRKIISEVFEKKCNLFLQVKNKNKWNKQDKIIKRITS